MRKCGIQCYLRPLDTDWIIHLSLLDLPLLKKIKLVSQGCRAFQMSKVSQFVLHTMMVVAMMMKVTVRKVTLRIRTWRGIWLVDL